MLVIYLSMLDTAEEKGKFEEIYNIYRQGMFKLANKILNNIHDAEDTVQKAFLIITKNFSKVGEPNSLETKGFVYSVAKNTAIDIYRKKQSHLLENIDDYEENLEAETSVEDSVFFHIDAEKIMDKARELSGDYYYVLLYDQLGYDANETASILNISYDNARKRLQRAKSKLKTLTEKELMYNEE